MKHTQHVKHALTRGSGGMPSQEIFENCPSEIESESDFWLKIMYIDLAMFATLLNLNLKTR